MIDTGLVSSIGRPKKTYKKEKIREWFIGANIGVAFGYFFESTVAKVYGTISVRHS